MKNGKNAAISSLIETINRVFNKSGEIVIPYNLRWLKWVVLVLLALLALPFAILYATKPSTNLPASHQIAYRIANGRASRANRTNTTHFNHRRL